MLFLVVIVKTLRMGGALPLRLWFATSLLATRMGNQWPRLAGI